VTAYWFVKSVKELLKGEIGDEGLETVYTVGTTERKYWKRWKWLGVPATVRSRGLTREG
jgi:hypothetical protein